MKHILFAIQVLVLITIGVLLWQIYRCWKKIPEDETIGEERSRYMHRRWNGITICIALQAVLSITSTILRAFEIT